MANVYIVGAKRSAIGSFMGALATLHPADFSSQVLRSMLENSKIDYASIDEVLVGNVLSAGLKQGLARQISIESGLSSSIPASSINMVCGSGMKTVMNAYANIKAGIHNIVIAGGAESMSGAPFLIPSKIRKGIKMGNQTITDHMLHDSLMDAFEGYHMGITAENIAQKFSLTRKEQDEFSIESQRKAIQAQESKRFVAEIVPIIIKTRKPELVFDQDEYINRVSSIGKLASLRSAFKKDGKVTAGNSSGINDGASFIFLSSEKALKKQNLTPLVEVISIGQGGVEPSLMGLGPVPAIRQALALANLELKDMDILELNEAFAAQSLGVISELSKEHKIAKNEILKRTNINGGSIALGHPVGASGNRIIVTLVNEMMKNKSIKYGLASLCIGGGMGTAIILKNV